MYQYLTLQTDIYKPVVEYLVGMDHTADQTSQHVYLLLTVVIVRLMPQVMFTRCPKEVCLYSCSSVSLPYVSANVYVLFGSRLREPRL